MTEVIREDDLRRVYTALHRMRAQWREIGLQLGVGASDLDAIQRGSGTHDHLMQVLILWLRNAPRPTWCDIVVALRHPSVNRLNVAEDVRLKYCPEYDPQPMSFNPLVTPTPTAVAPPQPIPGAQGPRKDLARDRDYRLDIILYIYIYY